jgi:hypothetical protein
MNVPMISIVDDDVAMRKATKQLVRSFGYSASTFASADEFLKSDQVHDTSCLITDLQMPGLTEARRPAGPGTMDEPNRRAVPLRWSCGLRHARCSKTLSRQPHFRLSLLDRPDYAKGDTKWPASRGTARS